MTKHKNFKDKTGQRFGRLTCISPVEPYTITKRWLCKCDCGKEVVVIAGELPHGGTKSCGCLKTESAKTRMTTHGMKRSRTYRIWGNMKQRCCNPNNSNYGNYGGRGIKVCDRWLESFEKFLEDMGNCPDGLSIERVDNEKGYGPENCKWDTPANQVNNTRANKLITINGVTKTAAQWSQVSGVPYATILYRFNGGWDPISAVYTLPHHVFPNGVSFNGKTLPLSGWAKEMGVPCMTLICRLKRGWSIEDTLSIPSGHKRPIMVMTSTSGGMSRDS